MLKRLRLVAALLVPLAAGTLHAQDTKIRGFSDVTYGARHDSPAPNAFGLGQLDLYITSKLNERLSFLGETVFEYDDDVREFVVDVERVVIAFDAARWARISAGKVHAPIGYWNNAYHHGEALQPTIGRPSLFAFEDGGGMLPVHSVGLMLSGRDLTRAHLGYDLLVSNNTGGTAVSDADGGKAVTAAVHTQVTNALRLGASLYADRLIAGTPSLRGDTLAASLQERIVGGYAAYFGSSLELVGEYQQIRTTGSAARTPAHGIVGYLGYRVGQVVPYARYDATRCPEGDRYLAAGEDQLRALGVRYEAAAAAVGKVELRRRLAGDGRWRSELATQIAVGF